jgi:hypothetical protein
MLCAGRTAAIGKGSRSLEPWTIANPLLHNKLVPLANMRGTYKMPRTSLLQLAQG